MTQELKEYVTAKVRQYIQGTITESNKFEVKKRWYPLRGEKALHEFLKDIAAMVNSYGGEDAFIVFGIDENTKEISPTSLLDSGYSDLADIRNLMDSNIDSPIRFDLDTIEINNNTIAVLHFPPSTEKPHYVLKYKNGRGQFFENEIFIRSGSSITVANKSDVDRMYIERNTIVVERKIEVSINISMLTVKKNDNQSGYFIDHPLTIENLGARTAAISRIELDLVFGEPGKDGKVVHFYSVDFAYKNLLIASGQLFSDRVVFNTLFDDDVFYRQVILRYIHTNTVIRECRIVFANNESIYPIIHINASAGKFPITTMDFLS